MKNKNIIVTGGAGYIGSHCCVELINCGYTPIIVDNLCNAKDDVVERIQDITGHKVSFCKVDVRDEKALEMVFADSKPEAVMHFAGLKAVGESVEYPQKYYENNVSGTISLLRVMEKHDVHQFVFSSSATVYSVENPSPFDENMPTGDVTNPYGRSKYIVEEMIKDICQANSKMSATILRYFNPVGAHESGLIGEDPQGIPNNLMPYIAKVANGELDQISIYGDDYDTIDGTGVRDYIHVMDLARGHVMVLGNMNGLNIYNLGSGQGYSVKQVIDSYKKASGRHNIPYQIAKRRAGDIAMSFANVDSVFNDIGWKTTKTLDDMCVDSWRWIQNKGS